MCLNNVASVLAGWKRGLLGCGCGADAGLSPTSRSAAAAALLALSPSEVSKLNKQKTPQLRKVQCLVLLVPRKVGRCSCCQPAE